ncbi:MAG: pirin family protein [Deltaproteobacteria bacterium]|nr:pirin family protein [Deltaproteobacteria bacterium]
MLKIRKAEERGGGNHGWLDTKHTFSFSDYYDPEHMGFRALRVINEDRITPAAGFPTHGHRDMEIISYVLEGALAHRDSMGTGSVIRPGDVQKMSAGTGVTHSEFNNSKTEGARFLQIWIVPEAKNLPPNYDQKAFGDARKNQLCLVASRGGDAGSLKVAQDMRLWATVLEPGVQVTHQPGTYKYGWLQVANGSVELNGQTLQQGDGVAITDEATLTIKALSSAEVLVFDLA